MAVAGTGDVEGTLHPAPFLTSVRWARAKLGRMAGEVMIRQLNKDPASLRAHVLKPELVIRQSTAPPLKA
jgi:DNA-binding LacI/PurR family transcriptional regulator